MAYTTKVNGCAAGKCAQREKEEAGDVSVQTAFLIFLLIIERS